MARRMQHDIFFVSSKFSVGVMIGSGSVISVMGAKYRNHYAQIVMVGISVTVTDKLNVNRVIILPIYVFVFIDVGRSDLDVSAVNTSYDIWEVGDSMKRCFHSSCLSLLMEMNVTRHQSGERSSYSMDGSAHCRITDAKQITNDQLKTAACKETQC